jgi:hypothetical protein
MRTRPAALLLPAALALAGPPAAARPYTAGPEFQVNSFTPGDQEIAAVAAAPAGEFAVAWMSYRSGASGWDVAARRYDREGNTRGGEFSVNARTAGFQGWPAVAAGPGGGFVVVWKSSGGFRSGWEITARLFDAGGRPAGPEFQVNTHTSYPQVRPAVAADASGGFVVWQGYAPDGGQYGILGRRYDGGGAPTGPEFQMNVVTDGDQEAPSVAMRSTGEFVVAFRSLEPDSDPALKGRLYDAAGAPLGGEIRIDAPSGGDRGAPSAAPVPDGGFVAAWTGSDPGGGASGVFGRWFDAGGAGGAEFPINESAGGVLGSPSAASDPAGNVVVVWDSIGPDGPATGIFGRRYASTGTPVGGEFQVNTYRAGLQIVPRAAMDAAGRAVVVWSSEAIDGAGFGISGQRLAGPPLITAPMDGDVLDCTDPSGYQPALAWEPLQYDRFRVLLSWDPRFDPERRVSSGERLLGVPAWSPPARRWRRACARAVAAEPADPRLYIKVLGVDDAAAAESPGRRSFGNVAEAGVRP